MSRRNEQKTERRHPSGLSLIHISVFISELAPDRFVRIIKPAVELLAGIPSVLYGAFGLGIIVPLIKKVSPMVQGQSLLAVIIVLTIMT